MLFLRGRRECSCFPLFFVKFSWNIKRITEQNTTVVDIIRHKIQIDHDSKAHSGGIMHRKAVYGLLSATTNQKEESTMTVPEAKQAMEQFKMEAANEVGVALKQGYNGDLTAKQAGSIGGHMVKKMVEDYENRIK